MAWPPFTRANHDRSRLRYASDTTDEEWCVIEPLMPDDVEDLSHI